MHLTVAMISWGFRWKERNMRCARFDWIAFATSNWSRWTSSSHELVKQKLVHVLNCFQIPGTFPGATKLIDKCFEFAESIENLISQVEFQNVNWCEQKSLTEQFDWIENLEYPLKRFNLWLFNCQQFFTLLKMSLSISATPATFYIASIASSTEFFQLHFNDVEFINFIHKFFHIISKLTTSTAFLTHQVVSVQKYFLNR